MFRLSQKTELKRTVQLNVSKGYCGSESSSGHVVLDNLNIDVKDGEFVNMEHYRNGDYRRVRGYII
jgi:hypothetical protein